MSAEPNTHISREAVLRNVDRLGINYGSLPQPPFWGPMFGYSQEALKFAAASRVMFASASVGRPLSPSEKNAMAYYAAKSMVTLSYTPPIALGISYAFWRKGFGTYRFPFYQPKPSVFNPNKFAFLQGALAQRAWHTFRGLTYYSIAHVFVYGFLTSYSLSSFMAALETDPTFEDFRSAMKHRRGGRQPLGPPAQRLPPADAHTEETDRDSASFGQGPESGYDADTSFGSSSYGQDAGVPVQAPRTAPVGRATSWQRPPQQPPLPEAAPYDDDAPEDDPNVFDDASPVAAPDRRPGSQQPGQRGSAWDRLRRTSSANQTGPQRGGAEAPAGAWQRRRQEEETSRGARDGTSFSFSSSDEERAFAKEQAQKEFDEMLERERRGGSSSS